MDQEKIGKFIATCRKEQKLTQEQLAEKLGITYKAVSKWECGKGLPDASIMMELCKILKITVNDLLSGEKINDNDYMIKAEENFIYLKKKVDKVIRVLCIVEWIMVLIMVILFLTHMYFNWLYKGPWDDSKFSMISNVLLFFILPFSLITEALKYEIKK